jgi:hypothetical protein
VEGCSNLPYLEAETPGGWRLQMFHDANRGFFYPRRWILPPTDPSGGRTNITPGLRNYPFERADAAMDYAYRERLQRDLLSWWRFDGTTNRNRPSRGSSS